MSFRYLTNDLLDEINAFEQKIGNKQQPEIVARCLFEIWRRYRASAISVLRRGLQPPSFSPVSTRQGCFTSCSHGAISVSA